MQSVVSQSVGVPMMVNFSETFAEGWAARPVLLEEINNDLHAETIHANQTGDAINFVNGENVSHTHFICSAHH